MYARLAKVDNNWYFLQVMHTARKDSGPQSRARATLAAFIDRLQMEGRYDFTRTEAAAFLHSSATALKRSISRLAAKGRLLALRRGFYVIVPIEYAASGGPPASWYIDDLMKFLDRPYYVGLLSAAALHGAAHRQVQELQVVTAVPLRPIQSGRARIRFFMKDRIGLTHTKPSQTETGTMAVATAEATSFDVVRYASRLGGVSVAATVLAELSEVIDPKSLVAAAKREGELSVVQRTGYLLAKVGRRPLTRALEAWLARKATRPVPLRAERGAKREHRDAVWNIVVNEEIEVDE